MEFDIDQFYSWCESLDIDFWEAMNLLESLPYNEETGKWTAADDGNGIPDFLEALVVDPIHTNDSQGVIINDD